MPAALAAPQMAERGPEMPGGGRGHEAGEGQGLFDAGLRMP